MQFCRLEEVDLRRYFLVAMGWRMGFLQPWAHFIELLAAFANPAQKLMHFFYLLHTNHNQQHNQQHKHCLLTRVWISLSKFQVFFQSVACVWAAPRLARPWQLGPDHWLWSLDEIFPAYHTCWLLNYKYLQPIPLLRTKFQTWIWAFMGIEKCWWISLGQVLAFVGTIHVGIGCIFSHLIPSESYR